MFPLTVATEANVQRGRAAGPSLMITQSRGNLQLAVTRRHIQQGGANNWDGLFHNLDACVGALTHAAVVSLALRLQLSS